MAEFSHDDYLGDILEQSCCFCFGLGDLTGDGNPVSSCIDDRETAGRVQITEQGIRRPSTPVEKCGIYRAVEMSKLRPRLERLG